MGFEVWDVTNIPAFPNQENSKEVTARPAIIIEDLQDEVALCPVTKQLHQVTNYKYAFEILKNTPEGQQMGLTFDSLVVLDRVLSLGKIRLAGKIGSCPQSIIDKIEDILQQMRENGEYV
ncbi:MAG: type II toxin-antitoxin system PemK/MazF family toxin [Bacteroidota bacterium]